MKHYEDRVIPERIDRVCKNVTCDLCGATSKSYDWTSGVYEVNETDVNVVIKHKSGESYPSGGWGTTSEIDMCPKCFQEKLIPWVKSQGGNVREEEWDF